jgi:hypothetical protein
MSADVDTLQNRLIELRDERATLMATRTKQDLHREVVDWISIAKAQAAGAARLVLGGQASGEHLARVLFEDRLDDEDLADRIVARLERDGFGKITDRQRSQTLARLDKEVKQTEVALREARKAAAIAELEAQFSGEAA